jgi:chemotaxis methyl-accepting protein methylase
METMNGKLEEISTLLLEKYGADVSHYDESFLEMSVAKRLSVTGCYSLNDYHKHLKNTKSEAVSFVDSLNISFSEFFRNPLTYAYIEQMVLPLLIEKKKKENNREIRIWSAACASGQEAYSIAMLWNEVLPASRSTIDCRIFATDCNPEEIIAAQKGVYQMASIGKVAFNRVQTCFNQQKETFSIKPELKKQVDFSIFNLLDKQLVSPPASIYGDFDVIFCCNLLFYYKPEFRHQILDKISRNLAADGFLITGETEREIVKEGNYREVFVNSAIFKEIGNLKD